MIFILIRGKSAKSKEIKIAREKATIKGRKKINKAIKKSEKLVTKAVKKAESQAEKKSNNRVKIRRCTGCGKERISKNNKCINCKIDTMLKYLSRFEKLIDALIKHLPTKS